MWFKQGQIEVECGDENGYGSGECGDECGDGNAEDITKIYDSVNKSRLGIAGKLKGIARIIDNSLDGHDYNVVTDDNSTNETNDDLLL